LKLGLAARAALLSLLIALVALGAWHVATLPKAGGAAGDGSGVREADGARQAEDRRLPTLAQLGATAWKQLSNPFYDAGSNDKGIGIQLAYSLGRVGLGLRAGRAGRDSARVRDRALAAIHRALDPFIQVLKPISPLAWMPLALYTIKDSATSSIFVIFICSLWPMLINTAHGVASVRRDWLNVARTLEAGRCAPASR
jgi:nitrate/nitrite transport system permease protein